MAHLTTRSVDPGALRGTIGSALTSAFDWAIKSGVHAFGFTGGALLSATWRAFRVALGALFDRGKVLLSDPKTRRILFRTVMGVVLTFLVKDFPEGVLCGDGRHSLAPA